MEQPSAKLVVRSGKLSGKTYEIPKALVIGRGQGVPVRIPDGKVSREHSKIFRQGADYYIVDLNSRNGTIVNRAKVTRRLLRDGDEILLGETTLRFENPPPARQTSAGAESQKEKKAAYREVIDLSHPPETTKTATPAAPAGARGADQIVIRERALQFSRYSQRRKPSLFFDDLGQRSAFYQLLIALVVLILSAGFLLLGLYVGGVVGG